MIEIVIRGGPKSGKSMLADLLKMLLGELMGARIQVLDASPHPAYARRDVSGVGKLVRKMFCDCPITIRVQEMRQ